MTDTVFSRQFDSIGTDFVRDPCDLSACTGCANKT